MRSGRLDQAEIIVFRRAGLLPKLLDTVRAAGAEAVFVPGAVHFDGGKVPARHVR
ncbi:hypothetical protein [Nocardia sp. NPDC004860]|uniref:hypothetical protein n=1 Tax=Nocardia sp. NPDC004860 TaxID=3154557 RepID=UPI0033B85FD5